MKRGLLKPDTFSRVLGSISAHPGAVEVVVLYHGGEPLLNKDLPEMVRRVKALGVPFVKTVSNGMLFPVAAMDAVIRAGLDVIEFSLDGLSPDENNFVRRDGDFLTVVANVKELIGRKRHLGSATPRIFIANAQFLVPGQGGSARQDPPPPRYLLDAFGEAAAGGIEGFKCTWAMRWPHMEILEDVYEVYRDPEFTEELNACDHVDNTVTVRWNGDVVACCYDLTSRFVLGNVHEEDLAQIWNGRKYQGLRRSIETRRFIPMCANCNVVRPGTFLVYRPELRKRFHNSPSPNG
jgi:radical SAM protein with 4Fe4S-binding SPASM domain